MSDKSKQAEGTDDPQARLLQKRLRVAITKFAATQVQGDDLMMISGVMTECVAMWGRAAGIVARGEHFAGAHTEEGNA